MDLQLARAANDAERSGLRIRLAGVTALLALPRVDVLRLRMELPPAVPDGPDLLGDKLQAAFDCPADEPRRREALLCDVLDLAATLGGSPQAAPCRCWKRLSMVALRSLRARCGNALRR